MYGRLLGSWIVLFCLVVCIGCGGTKNSSKYRPSTLSPEEIKKTNAMKEEAEILELDSLLRNKGVCRVEIVGVRSELILTSPDYPYKMEKDKYSITTRGITRIDVPEFNSYVHAYIPNIVTSLQKHEFWTTHSDGLQLKIFYQFYPSSPLMIEQVIEGGFDVASAITFFPGWKYNKDLILIDAHGTTRKYKGKLFLPLDQVLLLTDKAAEKFAKSLPYRMRVKLTDNIK